MAKNTSFTGAAQVSLNDGLDCFSRLDVIYVGSSWALIKAKMLR